MPSRSKPTPLINQDHQLKIQRHLFFLSVSGLRDIPACLPEYFRCLFGNCAPYFNVKRRISHFLPLSKIIRKKITTFKITRAAPSSISIRRCLLMPSDAPPGWIKISFHHMREIRMDTADNILNTQKGIRVRSVF